MMTTPRTTPEQREALRSVAEHALGEHRPTIDPATLLDLLDDLQAAEIAGEILRAAVHPAGADEHPCIEPEAYETAVTERDQAAEAADRRLLQSVAWQERAERAEAHLDTLKALVDEWLASSSGPTPSVTKALHLCLGDVRTRGGEKANA